MCAIAPDYWTLFAGRVLLGRHIARAREGVHAPPLRHRHLSDQVGGRAEAVQAQHARVIARQAQRAPADQAGAQQRGGAGVVQRQPVQRHAEAGVGHGMRGKAAVEGAASELGRVAQVFLACQAVAAPAAGAPQPGHADALAQAQRGHAGTQGVHRADHLVARHHWPARHEQITVLQVQVGAADGAGAHAQAHLAGAGLGQRAALGLQRLARAAQHHGQGGFGVALHGRPAGLRRCPCRWRA